MLAQSGKKKIEHCEIFCCLQGNQLAQQIFKKFDLMLGVFYAYTEERKSHDCFLRQNKPLQYVQNKTHKTSKFLSPTYIDVFIVNFF